MKKTLYKTPIRLSIILIVLSAIASFGGIFVNDIYRDNELIKAVWLGNDIVTLFIVIPIFLITQFIKSATDLDGNTLVYGLQLHFLYVWRSL